MSILKKVLLVLGIGIAGLFVVVATRPGTYRVERSQKIEAPADIVFAQLDDFKSWAAWSPWDKLDPAMQKSYEGPAEGVGAGYSWQGNDKVGKGRMTITEASPPNSISYRLEFLEPFASVSTTTFLLKPEGDKSVTATWSMSGNNNLMGKAFGLFMDMDKMIGGDFEKGLATLKTIAEAEAKKRAQAAQAAAPPPPAAPPTP
jgi:uncharacterized protein YndB with AHSA1/START domain